MAKKRRSSPAAASAKKKPRKTSSGFWTWLTKAFLLALIWGGIFTALFIGWCALDLPDIHQVTQAPRRPSVTLESDDGTVFARFGDLYGNHVTLDELPKYVPEAVIAIEDRRFYSHFGIDILGILRAIVQNMTGHHLQGASTLTQQLAKNLFLSPERKLKRKVQEMILALWLEHNYTKDQILTAYLNRVYLGNGAFGVDAAARIYFDKPASELNLREAAIIAGLLKAPSRYAPSHDPALAMERATTVLQTMVEARFITDAQRKAALSGLAAPKQKPGAGGDGKYFADWVADQIEPMVQDTAQDIVVTTTLNLALQRMAERHVSDVLAHQNGHDVSQAALVSLEHDGAVAAMVGGRDFRESQFNRATQAMRQPGSAFKPIVYLAAIEQGLSPDDVLQDTPIHLGNWSPENFDGKYHGAVTAREALAESINTVAVRVFLKAGADHVIDTARALGITSALERDPALALGASEVSPLELTSVYATLAAGGHAVTPYAIKEIRNRQGQTLYRHPDVRLPETVDSSAVRTLIGMMEEVVRSGTGKRAALEGHAVAGKTGTSSDYRDAWFLGFTGNVTTGIWLGNDDNSPMRKVVGGSLPAQLWHDYMAEAVASPARHDLFSGNDSSDWSGGVTEDISRGISSFINGILGSDKTEATYPTGTQR
jgi:penicillin-binding protein 1A